MGTIKSEIEKLLKLANGYLLKPTSKQELVAELLKYLPFETIVDENMRVSKIDESFKTVFRTEKLSDEFCTEYQAWYNKSEIARKSLNTQQLTVYLAELQVFGNKYKVVGIEDYISKLTKLMNAFAIGKIKEKLKELNQLYDIISKRT